MDNTDYFTLNRNSWDRRVKTHIASAFYDVEGFLSGKTSLREIELQELGEVSGRSLLHLQCHFGLDTLSWARLGARCTGVDISPAAIEQANRLKQQTGLNASFVCSDVYGYQRGENDPFDIVYTSYGAICWLPDLTRWAELVADNLAIGGRFYMVEFHPIYDLLEGYSYFSTKQPVVETDSTYTENGADTVDEFAVWSHPLSEVINALLVAGIQIERVNEYPFSPYNCFTGLEEREPGRFYLSHKGHDTPLVYSVKGHKAA